jgi:protein-tyrosine phosphatase
MPRIIDSMRLWLGDGQQPDDDHDPRAVAVSSKKKTKKRVAVLHCKAGKGRSGTIACSYLIALKGWSVDDALKRFTERRMRPGWGVGISIRSQRRWIDYVERWAKDNNNKQYTEKKVKIIEVRTWGQREGVAVLIRGFVDDGRKIRVLYAWDETQGESLPIPKEEDDVSQEDSSPDGPGGSTKDYYGKQTTTPSTTTSRTQSPAPSDITAPYILTIFRPAEPLIVATQDINVEVERRNRSSYGLPTMVTSTAHSWFNTYFEGRGPQLNGVPQRTGTYTVEWDAMDGLKGSSRRGIRAVDKVAVVWEMLDDDDIAEQAQLLAEELHEEVGRVEGEEERKSGLAVEGVTDKKESIVEGEEGAESDAEEDGIQSYGLKGERV